MENGTFFLPGHIIRKDDFVYLIHIENSEGNKERHPD